MPEEEKRKNLRVIEMSKNDPFHLCSLEEYEDPDEEFKLNIVLDLDNTLVHSCTESQLDHNERARLDNGEYIIERFI